MPIPSEDLYTMKSLGAGKIARHDPALMIETMANGDSVVIPFGYAAMRDSTDPILGKIFADSTAEFVGVAVNSVDTHETDSDKKAYEVGAAMGICTRGSVMVVVEEAVKPGDAVRIRHTAQGDGVRLAGMFCTTSDSGKTAVVTGARWDSEVTASGTAAVYLNGVFSLTADA
jgi:hypothetical protein